MAANSKTKEELKGQIDSTKAKYSDAHEKYLKESKWVFNLHTPLRTFTLRAKHEAAMQEWLRMVCFGGDVTPFLGVFHIPNFSLFLSSTCKMADTGARSRRY